jgi:hypothetical protein
VHQEHCGADQMLSEPVPRDQCGVQIQSTRDDNPMDGRIPIGRCTRYKTLTRQCFCSLTVSAVSTRTPRVNRRTVGYSLGLCPTTISWPAQRTVDQHVPLATTARPVTAKGWRHLSTGTESPATVAAYTHTHAIGRIAHACWPPLGSI